MNKMDKKDYILSKFPKNDEGRFKKIKTTLIFSNNEEKVDKLFNSFPIIEVSEYRNNCRGKYMTLKNGEELLWLIPGENNRGYKCSKAYIDEDIDIYIFNNVTRYNCMFCTRDSVTVF